MLSCDENGNDGYVLYNLTQEFSPNTINMTSINLILDDLSVSSVFGDLDILFVIDDDANYYFPSFGVNQIGDVAIGEGYKVFLSGTDSQSFSVEGMATDVSTMLTLDPYTFNMIGFLPQYCIDIEDVFADYENHILVVKNDNNDYYVPAFGVTTLDEMCPGEAYGVFLNSGDYIDFMYPIGANESTVNAFMDDYKLRTRTNSINKSGESHLVILTSISGEVQEGDVLRAYANNELVGEINIVSEHLDSYPIDLVAIASLDLSEWGGPILSGYVRGDAIEIRLFSSQNQVELIVDVDLNVDVYGEDEQMSVGSGIVYNQSIIP